MKKTLTVLLSLVLVLTMALPVSALTGFVYDETEQLDTPELWHQNALLEESAQKAGIQTEVFVLTYTGEGNTLMDLAESIWQGKETPPESYVCLMIQANPDEQGWHLNEEDPWCLLVRADAAQSRAFLRNLEAALNLLLTPENWAGDLEEDQNTLALTTAAVVAALEQEAAEAALPATPHVMDDARLLTPQQRQDLNEMAQTITETYGIGIYVMSAADFRDYGEEAQIFDVLWNYYHDEGLGYGENREGMILMLSLEDRDFATFFYGENTEYAFNGYGQQQLENSFLPAFAEDDWFGGFRGYLTAAEDYMALAAAGDPVRDNPWHLAMLFILIALFVSFVITRILWMRMNNVAAQKGAHQYLAGKGLELTFKHDQLLGRTETRQKIEKSGSGGSSTSSAHSGGGGSGRSGKF